MRSFLGASVILSSIALLIGCVWFTHRQANPVMLPGSKSISHLIPPPDRQKAAQAVMPGSKSGTDHAGQQILHGRDHDQRRSAAKQQAYS